MTCPLKRYAILLPFVTAVLPFLIGSAHQAHAADKPQAIEGTWSVVSVELAGQKVDGLEGAELTFSKGKKTFKLPGTVEKGTYTLDMTMTPKQIDSTTEGKVGTEKGIYVVEKGVLRLCLETQGSARPKEFATKEGTGRLLLVLKSVPTKDNKEPSSKSTGASEDSSPGHVSVGKPMGTRPFRMGFTGFVHDITPEAVAASRKFVREHGDILAHHIEGVPWAQALNGQPFPKAMLDEWEGKKSATPKNGKVYLAISPGRGDLKAADKAGPLPKELVGKMYDDPLVMKAYLNYCQRAIEFFRPDYLAVGIETNEIHDAGPKKWAAYAALHQHIYTELKKEHKDLPIFASWTLHSMFQKRGRMLEAFKKLMPYNDFVAVSYYPFFVAEKDRFAALEWMTEQFDSFKKPYAMVETNDAADRLSMPKSRLVIQGTPEKQAEYYRKLLSLAKDREFAFVVAFIHQDYDAMWEKIKSFSPELFVAWRDCGLLDENGKARPSYQVWKGYLELPLSK